MMIINTLSEFKLFAITNKIDYKHISNKINILTHNNAIISFSFSGNDHISIRFPASFLFEPFRVKKGSNFEYINNILIINGILGIHI